MKRNHSSVFAFLADVFRAAVFFTAVFSLAVSAALAELFVLLAVVAFFFAEDAFSAVS